MKSMLSETRESINNKTLAVLSKNWRWQEMKNRKLALSLVVILFLHSLTFYSKADEIIEEEMSFKMVFAEIGYGPRELTIGGGFRWDFIGLDLNLGGLIANTPRYIYPTQEYPYPKEYVEHRYPRTTVSINASYYYDINEFSIFGTVGYYSQTDTLLVRSTMNDNTLGIYYAKQGDPADLKSGICFGLGGQYFIDEKFGAGLGYHTKKGFYLQFGYYWY